MERNCEKCIYHISGSCSKWDCEMTTLEDYRKKVITDFVQSVAGDKTDAMIRCKTTRDEILDKFYHNGLMSVYNLGLCNMYDYLIQKMKEKLKGEE